MCLSSCSFKVESVTKDNTSEVGKLKQPDVPMTIISDQGRRDYLSHHYWDNFDFQDTALVHNVEYTEQLFADFTQVLGLSDNPSIDIRQMLMLASVDSLMFTYFTNLSEKYFYDPNSPMLNEEYYISVVEFMLESEWLSESEKIRPKFQLRMLLKNRKGHVAEDFIFETSNEKKKRMHSLICDYLILFFNDPDCHDCIRVKEFMAQSGVFNDYIAASGSQGIASKKLMILGIYPGRAIDLWQAANYPDLMINACDPSFMIQDKELYDLRAFPSLYLLDKDKRVILKDASIEAIEFWLLEKGDQLHEIVE